MEKSEISSDHFPPAQEQNPMLILEGGDEVPDGAEEGPSESRETETEAIPPQAQPDEDYNAQEDEIINSHRPLEEKAVALGDVLLKRIDNYQEYRDLSRALDAIIFGRSLLQIKVYVKESKMEGGWRGYIKTHLSPISERTVQNWMKLAKTGYCRPYVWMGEERLLKASRCAKKYGGDDPIAAFLKEAGIGPIPEDGWMSMETKRQIDAAIAKARPQAPKKSESGVNPLTDRLIDQLTGCLENVELLSKVDLGKLKTLEEKIKWVRGELGKK
jgi:hypothetical protein